MRKRKGSGLMMTPEMEFRIKNNCCPICGLNKDLWKRRKDWRCCSVDCSKEYGKLAWNDWSSLRIRAIARRFERGVKHKYIKAGRVSKI